MLHKQHLIMTDLPASAEKKLDGNANINLPRETSRIRGMIHQKKKMPAGPLQSNNMVEPLRLLQTKSKHGRAQEEGAADNSYPMIERQVSERAS